MLAHYSHCLYLVLFATGEERGKTAKRKTAKAIVSVFFSGSQGSHVWLAWLAWLAGSHIGHTPTSHETIEQTVAAAAQAASLVLYLQAVVSQRETH